MVIRFLIQNTDEVFTLPEIAERVNVKKTSINTVL